MDQLPWKQSSNELWEEEITRFEIEVCSVSPHNPNKIPTGYNNIRRLLYILKKYSIGTIDTGADTPAAEDPISEESQELRAFNCTQR